GGVGGGGGRVGRAGGPQGWTRRYIDPELRRQIQAARGGQDVPVVSSLQIEPARPREPGETDWQVRALMRRVDDQTGERAGESNGFENLGTFALSAPVGFTGPRWSLLRWK